MPVVASGCRLGNFVAWPAKPALVRLSVLVNIVIHKVAHRKWG